MWKFWYYLFFVNTISVCVKCNVTLEDIYQESKKAIQSGSVGENMKVISQYYFTHEKENSVWFIAEKASLDWFNVPLGREDMQFAETLILTVAKHYGECQKIARGLLKAQCFYHLATPIVDLERGTRFVTISEISHESKVKYGALYNSATLLIAHIVLIAKDNFEEFKSPYVIKDKMDDYIKTMDTSLRMLYDFDIDVVMTRVNAISAPVICEIHEKFWKEFEGICEVRWYTEGDSNEDINSTTRTIISETADQLNVVSVNEHYQSKEDDTALSRSDRIGSSCGSMCFKYRVRIVDGVKNKVLYEEYESASYSTRGDTMNMLARKAMSIREKATDEVEREVSNFSNNTFAINYKLLQEVSVMLKN